MKKIIFTLLGLLMITNASAASQTTFMPVLSEGKSWEVTTISWDYENFPNSNDTTGYYAVSVCGDTIVNNLTCKKIEIVPKGNQKSSKTAVAYEKDGKVWNVNSNGEMVLIFDIGLHQNEEVDAGYVVKEDFISVNGFNRKRLLIDSGIDSDDYSYYVVEGIGISSDKWVSKLGIGNENEYTIMLSCSENGEIVFTREDFSKQDDYIPLVREGVKWVEYYNNSIENTQWVKSYQFLGNTEIGGNVYSNLYATDGISSNLSQNDSPVAYVREQNKQVFIIPINLVIDGCVMSNEELGEYIIYDFNDITAPYTIDEGFMQPVTTEQMPYGDNMVNLYTLGNGISKKIAEGIGCLDYVFYNPWPMILPDGSHYSLAWFEDNGQIIYKGEDYDAAIDYLSEQTYVPLVREGVVWEYVGCRQYSHQHSLYALEFNGTTTIDGKVYHKIYRTDYDKQGNAQEPYFVAYVREENKIVSVYIDTYEQDEDFYYTYWWDIPKTLYDFSKPMFLPDEAYIIFGNDGPIDYNTNYYPSSSIEVEVGETTRKGYFIDHGNDDESFKTIEGIGVDCDFGDLLIPYRTFYTGFNPMASLAAVYENGELVYKGRAYDKAQRLKYPVVGDADDDGVVTSADITALYNYLLDSDYQYYETSDVDGDGEVTSADVTAVYNILLGNSSNDDNVTEYEVNGVKFKMLKVDGGSFLMGASGDYAEDYDNELPTHQVNLSTYYIGQTEVTQELWQAVMDNNPCKFNGEPYGTNLKRPVENVSWTDCQEFISRLNEMTGKSFRLPTEAEWEYAARGGKMSLGYVFSGSDNFEDVAWCNIPLELEGTLGYGTQTVATKCPNELGLYDMSGNVWEWCQDWFGSYNADAQTNPTGPETGTCRVCRGGSWLGVPQSCVVFLRNYVYRPSMRSSIVGLRLAM